MAEERRDYQVPPTRPTTPLNRDPRIAEAPSRADPRLPLLVTSSFHVIITTAHDHRDEVNTDLADSNGDRAHHITTSSNSASNMVIGNTCRQPNLDVTLSSCTDRFYVPTPQNSPVRRSNHQPVMTSTMAATRLRGGGPSKRNTIGPRGSTAKRKKISGGKSRAKKSKDDIFDDSEAALADGHSPLYDESNIAAILQHPLAQSTLAGSPIGTQLQGLTIDELRRATNDFRNDGRAGFNNPDYLQQGLAAMQRRANGDFNEFSKQKFFDTWIANADSSNSEEEMDRDLHAFDITGPGASNENKDYSQAALELDAFNGTGPSASNENMDDTHEARELDSFNATGLNISSENVEDPPVGQELDTSNGTGASAYNENMGGIQEARELDSLNAAGPDFSTAYVIDQPVARELDSFNDAGPGVSNEDKADAQEEKESEQAKNSFYIGDYSPRPNHHHRKDDDDPNGPAASGASHGTSGLSKQQAPTSQSHTTNAQGSNISHSGQTNNTWEEYFSNYVDIPAPPRHAITSIISPLKFEVMCRKQEHVGVNFQYIIKPGDILRLEIAGRVVKEVTLVREHLGQFIVSVPPGAHVRSEPDLRADLIYPSPNSKETITGPTQICNIVQHLVGLTADRPAWKSFSAVHESEVLGNITDIRQALEWSWTEGAFRAQLRFEKFRRRRLKPAQHEDGYEFINHSSLFRKVRTSEFARHNHDLIIDLGPRLNDKLALSADSPEFMIVMVDNRLFGSDGLFPAITVHIKEAFSQGHLSFPTRFCQDLAGSEGWSNGHAHIGPLGLGKGIGHSVWEGGKRNASNKGPGWLDVGALGADTTPPGVKWTGSEIQKVTLFHDRELRGQIRHFPIPINRSRQHWGLQPQQFRRTGAGQWILDPEFPRQGTMLTIQPSNRRQPGTMSSRPPQSVECARKLQNPPIQLRCRNSPAKASSLSHRRKIIHTKPLNPAMALHHQDVYGMDEIAFDTMSVNSQHLNFSIDDQDASGDSYYYPPSPTSEKFIPYFSIGESNTSNNHSQPQQSIELRLGNSNRFPPETFIDPLLIDSEHSRPPADPRIASPARSITQSAADPSVGSQSDDLLGTRNSHCFHATAAQLLAECLNGKPKSWVPPNPEVLRKFFTDNTLQLLPNPVSRSKDPPDALYPALTQEGAAVFATREWFDSQMRWVPISGLAIQCMAPTYGTDGKFNGWTERWVDAFSDSRLVRPYQFQDESIMTRSPLVSMNQFNNSSAGQSVTAASQLHKTLLYYSSLHRSNGSISSQSVARPICRPVIPPESSATIKPFEQHKVQNWGIGALRQEAERELVEPEAAEALRLQAKAALRAAHSTDKWEGASEVASVRDKHPSSDGSISDLPHNHHLSIEATLNPCASAVPVADNLEKEWVAFEVANAAPNPCAEEYSNAKYCSGGYARLSSVGATSIRQTLTSKMPCEDQSPSEHRAKRARLTQQMAEHAKIDPEDADFEDELTKATAPSYYRRSHHH